MNRKVYQLEAIGDTAHNWPKTRESTNTDFQMDTPDTHARISR